MDEKEIHKILRYKRPSDSWVCPECDTENSLTLGKCLLCGNVKPTNLTILKAWTEADDRPVTPPPKKPTSTTTSTTSGPVFKDDPHDIPEDTEESKNKIIWGLIIAIIIIGLLIAAGQSSNASAYSNAMEEFNSGNYATAIEMFEELPADYKDVSYMLDESKYQQAMEYYDDGDFTSAESLFDSISHHNDSANKVSECKYQIANELLNSGAYIEAKSKFQEISNYSDANDMASECDYRQALNYKNNGNYTDAMKLFNGLGLYKDSSSQFSSSENSLIQMNKRNGYYVNEQYLIGIWRDSSGNEVTYTNQENGSVNSSYSISFTEGQFFKISYGTHYHGNDNVGWKKQWIYQRVDSTTVNVYDYIDGQTYTLVKQ